MPTPLLAATLFTLTAAVVGAFHLALVLGAPWGELTLGGRWKGRLPAKARLIPLLSIVLLAFFSAVLLARAGFAVPFLPGPPRTLAWIVVGYCALGAVANAVSPSKRERNLWLPVVLGLLGLSLYVATS